MIERNVKVHLNNGEVFEHRWVEVRMGECGIDIYWRGGHVFYPFVNVLYMEDVD